MIGDQRTERGDLRLRGNRDDGVFIFETIFNANMNAAARQHFDAVSTSLQGVNAAVLAIAAFGVLCVTREYGTGMIRLTFLAEPSRLRVLAARKHMRYQTLLKQFVVERLYEEEKRQGLV